MPQRPALPSMSNTGRWRVVNTVFVSIGLLVTSACIGGISESDRVQTCQQVPPATATSTVKTIGTYIGLQFPESMLTRGLVLCAARELQSTRVYYLHGILDQAEARNFYSVYLREVSDYSKYPYPDTPEGRLSLNEKWQSIDGDRFAPSSSSQYYSPRTSTSWSTALVIIRSQGASREDMYLRLEK